MFDELSLPILFAQWVKLLFIFISATHLQIKKKKNLVSMYTVITQEHYYKLLGVPISNFFGMGGGGPERGWYITSL